MEVTALELYYHIDRILVPNSLQLILRPRTVWEAYGTGYAL